MLANNSLSKPKPFEVSMG